MEEERVMPDTMQIDKEQSDTAQLSAERNENNSPWPTTDTGKVLFILDVATELEGKILRQWIDEHRPTNSVAEQQVAISLSRVDGEFDLAPLASKLDTDDDTVLVPLRVLWLPVNALKNGMPRLRDLIFGDPRRPNKIRAHYIHLQRPNRVNRIIGSPATIAEMHRLFEAQGHQNTTHIDESFVSFVARKAGIVLDIAERRIQGGRYKVPRFVAKSLSARPSFKQEVENLALAAGKTHTELMAEANTYLKEMIAVPNTFYIDFMGRFNRFVLNLGYEDKIVCDQEALERTRKMVREHPSMMLWTHKTYLDGMVLPKVLYDNDFPLPHMFGGSNINFAGLGFLLRRSGAIFIRRSFQDNDLYKMTLRQYIGYLMEKRFPMTWAFEGTRSRVGKLMPPRYGLLKYVLEGCHATNAENIHIIPISISYDLIRDVDEYATEQTGRIKKAESLSWFVGYMRSLSKPMGRIYMDIGEPVVLEKSPDPDDKLALSKIAFEVAVQANKVTPITVPSQVTMSLLGAAPRALTTKELTTEVRELLDWARARNIRISNDFDLENTDHMLAVLDLMIAEGVISRYEAGPEVVWGIALEQHPRASYYRNTVIHFFVNKAIIELALLKASDAPVEQAEEVFWQEADNLRDLFKFEFFYAPTDEFHQQLKEELDRVDGQWQQHLQGGNQETLKVIKNMQPLVAHSTMLTFVEAYRVVADLVGGLKNDQGIDEKTCIAEALKYGHQMYLQRRISSEASIGKLLFKNGHQLMKNHGLTEGGGEDIFQQRKDIALQLRELARRLDRIRAMVIAHRGQ